MAIQVQTKPRPTSLGNVLFVFNAICSIFGQKSTARTKTGYKRSLLSVIFAVIHLSLYFTCLFFIGELTEYDFPSAIVVVLKEAIFIGNIIVMVYATIYCNTLSFKSEMKIITTFESIDEDLFGLKLVKELKTKNDFLKKISIIMLFGSYLIFYCLITTLIYFGFNDIEKDLFWKLYETMAPIIIISTMKMKFYMCALILRTRAEIINDFLAQKIRNCSSHVKHLEKLEIDIEIALKIHKKIVDAVRHMTRVFGFVILITFILTFILLLSDGYIVLFCLTVGKENNLFYIVCSTRLVIFYSIELLLSMRTTTLLCAEVNETKNILFNVKIEPENVDSRNVIMVSVFKLMHDKLEMKACELFDMDLSFVFSMFASLTTYLLILLQFDIDSIQRKARNVN